MRAAIQIEPLQHPLGRGHLGVKFGGNPGGIMDPQRAPLPRLFARRQPAQRQPLRLGHRRKRVQIILGGDAIGDDASRPVGRLS